jgi:hypothetical protein
MIFLLLENSELGHQYTLDNLKIYIHDYMRLYLATQTG